MAVPEEQDGHLWCEICNGDLGEAPDHPTDEDWADEKRAHARDLALFEEE
jgi:hypothetical protein